VPKGLAGNRACIGECAQCRGVAWHHSLCIDLHPEDEIAEGSGGGDIRSERAGAAMQICWGASEPQACTWWLGGSISYWEPMMDIAIVMVGGVVLATLAF
jgi:hypothetical protein